MKEEVGEAEAGSAGVPPVPGENEGRWRSRGYLPHFDRPNAIQAITFRLADALPTWKMAELRESLKRVEGSRLREELDAQMDAGYGSCLLKDPRIAAIVEKALLYFDGVRYRLIAWVVMPNHVHVVMESLPGFPMSEVLQSWKSFSAKTANNLLGRTGVFWQAEYFDRLVRDESHLRAVVEYIHANPVKAGLVEDEAEWSFSSAGRWDRAAGTGGTPALHDGTAPACGCEVPSEGGIRT